MISPLRRLLPLLLALLPFVAVAEACDVRDEAQRQIDWWNSFTWKTPKEYSFGLRKWHRANAIVTFLNNGDVWSFPRFISASDALTVNSCRVKVEMMECADGQWCLMEVQTTYGNDKGKTFSYREFWTWVYDPNSCLVQQSYILHDAKDYDRKQTIFSKGGSDEL